MASDVCFVRGWTPHRQCPLILFLLVPSLPSASLHSSRNTASMPTQRLFFYSHSSDQNVLEWPGASSVYFRDYDGNVLQLSRTCLFRVTTGAARHAFWLFTSFVTDCNNSGPVTSPPARPLYRRCGIHSSGREWIPKRYSRNICASETVHLFSLSWTLQNWF